ncbi:nitroreductase family deazaflavin-dependent oxidoreductase [Streptomyces glaucosporus]|uniref:Nitroreductase family deazaflavin-dependent oxidoreductase n=1 Tax=Streptomyces glaucosporus TaxID=284044 RepID=A0ABP5W5K0_9ACTN
MEPTEEVVNSPTAWVAEHIRQYVDSQGEQGHYFNGYPTLLLTTRGRRSGKMRRTALVYGRRGDDYVVVASNGGSPRHPLWYLNMTADPRVRVQVGANVFAAQARTASAEERPELWEMMTGIFEPYLDYQKGNEREIPVVVLEPAGRPGKREEGQR